MKNVVVIDDDDAILMAITLVLESEKHRVIVFHQAQKALNWIQEESCEVDLILLDLQMAEMTGRDFAGYLIGTRAYQRKKIPVLIMTASNLNQSEIASLPFVELLIKPFALDTLVSTCNRLLQLEV